MKEGADSSIPITTGRPWSVPLESAATPFIEERNRDEQQEGHNRDEAKEAESLVGDRPRVKKNDLDIEDDEGHGDQVVLDRNPAATRRARRGLKSRFVTVQLGGVV